MSLQCYTILHIINIISFLSSVISVSSVSSMSSTSSVSSTAYVFSVSYMSSTSSVSSVSSVSSTSSMSSLSPTLILTPDQPAQEPADLRCRLLPQSPQRLFCRRASGRHGKEHADEYGARVIRSAAVMPAALGTLPAPGQICAWRPLFGN